eukprot:jgi/Chrzof1/10669/Cz05g08010.t1
MESSASSSNLHPAPPPNLIMPGDLIPTSRSNPQSAISQPAAEHRNFPAQSSQETSHVPVQYLSSDSSNISSSKNTSRLQLPSAGHIYNSTDTVAINGSLPFSVGNDTLPAANITEPTLNSSNPLAQFTLPVLQKEPLGALNQFALVATIMPASAVGGTPPAAAPDTAETIARNTSSAALDAAATNNNMSEPSSGGSFVSDAINTTPSKTANASPSSDSTALDSLLRTFLCFKEDHSCMCSDDCCGDLLCGYPKQLNFTTMGFEVYVQPTCMNATDVNLHKGVVNFGCSPTSYLPSDSTP